MERLLLGLLIAAVGFITLSLVFAQVVSRLAPILAI